jgi:hypothetical protein
MKKLRGLAALLAVATLFMGCPYSSENAIDEKPTVKILPALLGKWEQRSSSDYNYVVTKTDEFNYKIEKVNVKEGKSEIYDGFISDVSGDKFFNIWEETANPRVYYLYKLDMSGGENMLKLASVTQNIDEKFTSSIELRKFIEKYKELSFFYEKDEDSYIKTGK